MFLLLYSFFFYQFTVYKVHRRFENRNFPFSERTNYTLDIKEQNYATYQYKRCKGATRFLAPNRRRAQNVLNLTATDYVHTLSVRKRTA